MINHSKWYLTKCQLFIAFGCSHSRGPENCVMIPRLKEVDPNQGKSEEACLVKVAEKIA